MNTSNVEDTKVGDTYALKGTKVNGGMAYDLSFDDEGCTHRRWLLNIEAGYVELALPSLCSTMGLGGPIPDESRAAHAKLADDFLKSITIY